MENGFEKVVRRNGLYGQEMREVDKRRVPQKDRKTHDIKQLWQKSHEILNYALQGFKHEEIARMVGVTNVTVSNTINSSLGQQKLAALRIARDANSVDVAERVTKMLGPALDIYESILAGGDENGKPSLALQKATSDTIVMDIGGHRAPAKIDTRNLNATLTVDELMELKERGKNAAKACGLSKEIGNA